MNPSSFYNVSDFPFLKAFIENIDTISGELNSAIAKSELVRNTLQLNSGEMDHYSYYWAVDNGFLYDINTDNGSFSAFAVYKKDFPIKTCNIRELFPFLTQLLKNVPDLYYSAFVRADPHCSLDKHAHNRQHLIFHLLLNDLENGSCIMTCGDEQKSIQKKGDAVLFDYSISHGTINESSSERFNLAIDFNPFKNKQTAPYRSIH